MSANVAELTELLLSKPEPLREDLGRYIADNLDEIEDEMLLVEGPDHISAELKAELDRRRLNLIGGLKLTTEIGKLEFPGMN